jgi:biopolymer transport protein ExbD
MGMKRPDIQKVEVDMVPLIDIVSLLLMFLVMVGDSSKSASAVKMKLPRASESKPDKEVKVEGRIVVQLKETGENTRKYTIIIDNRSYEMAGGRSNTLLQYFNEQINKRVARGDIKPGPQGQIDDIPVKLRIPTEAPMSQVQQAVMSIAAAKLTNVQYAIDNNPKK